MSFPRPDLFEFSQLEKSFGQLGHHRPRHRARIDELILAAWNMAPADKIPTADAVIAGHRQIIAHAHLYHLRIIGATLTPFEDTFHGAPLFGYYSEKERVRQAVNTWIRESGAYDGAADFDAVVRDPANPRHIKAEFDSGDHLHPNDAGYVAMADSIDLGALLGNKK
jgi:lysophospholipase L1-like esterase